jgi:DNA-binding MarR family transcriptional regulator
MTRVISPMATAIEGARVSLVIRSRRQLYMGTNVNRTSSRTNRDMQAILDAIRRIVQRLRESSRHAEQRHGLTAAQIFVLELLRDRDGLSVNDLAACTYTHQSSVSVVVSRLARRGLVRCRVVPADARRRAVSLTDKGRRALARAPAAAQTEIINAFRALPDGVRHELAVTLRRVSHSLGGPRRPDMFFEHRGQTRPVGQLRSRP